MEESILGLVFGGFALGRVFHLNKENSGGSFADDQDDKVVEGQYLILFFKDVSLTTYLSFRGSITSEAVPSSREPFNQEIASSFAALPPRNDSFIPIFDLIGSK